VSVTAPAAIKLFDKVTVKTLLENKEYDGSEVPAGAINLHTGVAGHENPVNVVKILPDAGIAVAVVPVIVTVAPVDPAI